MSDELLEKLADIEHEQWMDWSKAISKELKEIHDIAGEFNGASSCIEIQDLIEIRLNRWNKLWIPYNELSEEMKESDREYARKVLGVIKE